MANAGRADAVYRNAGPGILADRSEEKQERSFEPTRLGACRRETCGVSWRDVARRTEEVNEILLKYATLPRDGSRREARRTPALGLSDLAEFTEAATAGVD